MRRNALYLGDAVTLLAVLILFSLGSMVLYTASTVGVEQVSWTESLLIRQLLFGFIAAFVLFIVQQINPIIGKTLLLQVAAALTITVLLLGLFFLGPVVNETHRWYQLGKFLLQPSEFAKLYIALWTSFWLTQTAIPAPKRLLFGTLGVVIPLLLIILQPDFGATIIMLLMVASMIVVWLVKFKTGRYFIAWFISIAIIILFAAKFSWFILILALLPTLYLFKNSWKVGVISSLFLVIVISSSFGLMYAWTHELIPNYVRSRIESFTGATEISFQVRQSRIAIGSGNLWGKGIAQGTQSRLKFLPEYTTDFIFATFVEERGYAGVLLLFLIYIIFFGRLIMLTLEVQDEYARLIMIALIVKLWFETFLNIGMNMGALPTKGVALPFVSYGGSSLVANSLLLGVILSLYRYESKRDTMSPSFGLA